MSDSDLKTGYIYEISSRSDGKKYYGSTFNQVEKRIQQHKNALNSYLNGRGHFTTSFYIIKDNKYDVSVVERVDNTSPKHLHERERYYIENNECVNKLVPNRNKYEYYIDNSQKIKDKMNQHYQNDINNYRTNKLLRYQAKKERQYDKYLQKIIMQELID